MKFSTRLFSLLLAGSMIFSLTACSGKDTNELSLPSEAVSPSPSVSPDETSDSLLSEDFVVDTSAEDICLATLGVPGDFELFTVNGTPVTAYNYLYWLRYCISEMETYMSYYGITIDLSTDATFAEYAKEDALSVATQYSIIESKAKELGYELTEAQISELEFNMALSAEYLGGEEVFLDELRKSGFDYDTFYSVSAVSYYYAQLKDGLFSTPPTDEEMDAYFEENDIMLAKHILLTTMDPSTYETLDEATIAQKKATAEDILTQLQNSTDLETDFDALMNEYSEDTGLANYPDGYTFTSGEMVTEFEEATRALEFGQISGLVESPYGYHIILRLDPDTEDARTNYLNTQASNQIATWTSEADIILTDEYNAIDVTLFYTKYIAYQNAFSEEAAAIEETTAAESQEN